MSVPTMPHQKDSTEVQRAPTGGAVTSGTDPKMTDIAPWIAGKALYCTCGRKLKNLGPGVVIERTRSLVKGEPLRHGETDELCDNSDCRQRWAVTFCLAPPVEGPIL